MSTREDQATATGAMEPSFPFASSSQPAPAVSVTSAGNTDLSPSNAVYPSPLGSTPVASGSVPTRHRVDVSEYLEPQVAPGVGGPLFELSPSCRRSMEDPRRYQRHNLH